MAGGKPGPARKPSLQVVREGNPGHRPVRDGGLKLLPKAPREPDWREWFPNAPRGEGQSDRARDNTRCRMVARRAWRLIVPQLDAQGLLSTIDGPMLTDTCLCVARIDMGERDISRFGLWVMGERGAQKNPSVTAVNQYRAYLKFYIGQLGLSPAARDALAGGGDDEDEDNPFDV